jgi:hypothetical protein
MQLHEAQAQKRLADRADVKQPIRLERDPPLQILETVIHHPLHTIGIGQSERQTRRIHLTHVLLDIAVESIEGRCIAFGARGARIARCEDTTRGDESTRAETEAKYLAAVECRRFFAARCHDSLPCQNGSCPVPDPRPINRRTPYRRSAAR